MDGMGAMVIQNLDSLWFFSNVLVSINNPQTPPQPPPPSKISDCLHRDSRLGGVRETGCPQPYPCENRKTVSPPPLSTIPKEKHNNITISNKNNTIISNSPSTPKTTPTKFEHPNDETPPSPTTTTTTTTTPPPPPPPPRDEGRSSKRMRSKKQGWNKIREIRREIKSKNKVDWDENDDDHDRVVEIIPPYKDDDAMKKHLRSWAVVVAYTAVHNTRSNPFMVAACS